MKSQARKKRILREQEKSFAAAEARRSSPQLQAVYDFVLPVRQSRYYTPKFRTDKWGNRVRNTVISKEAILEEASRLKGLLGEESTEEDLTGMLTREVVDE